MLDVRTIYQIKCPVDASYTFTGYDPGPLSIALAAKTLTPVTSRANTKNHNIDFLADCNGKRAYRFTTTGLRGRARPILTSTDYRFHAQPGEVYLVYCPDAGIWDAEPAKPIVLGGVYREPSYRRA